MVVDCVIFLLAILFLVYLVIRLTLGTTNSQTCLIGKTAIVTGGNTGIGYQVALNLACRGCRVIIADKDDAEASRRRIVAETGNPNVFVKHLDLASFSSVREFADNIKLTERKLDILVNNAGVGANSNKYTQDGLHPIMQINSFGHFLLTHLLIDLLKKSAPSRVIFTSAMVAFTHCLSLDTLNFPMGHPNTLLVNNAIYGNSKMCNIIIADGFAEKLEGTGVTSNSVHPGGVRTELYARGFGLLNVNVVIATVWNLLLMVYGKSAWEGAQTTIHVAVAKELEHVSGVYFWDCAGFAKPALANDKKSTKQIWYRMEELAQLSPSERI